MDKETGYDYDVQPSVEDWEEDLTEETNDAGSVSEETVTEEYDDRDEWYEQSTTGRGHSLWRVVPVVLLLLVLAAVITGILWNYFHGSILDLFR